MASDLVLSPQSIEFTPDQVELIKRTVAVGATDDELQLFMYVAKKTGLDPFTRQIYAIKRQNKMGIQTGIDGYRVVADRTGKLAGISDPTHTEPEGGKYPLTASVTVKKLLPNGSIADFTATARWSEYNAGGPMWAKMPFLMLGKCAEALALRKAFPADLSGVYTTEEMAQADNGQQEAEVRAEIERQKAVHAPATINEAVLANVEKKDGYVPPELDWSYQKTTGVLICRVEEAKKLKKKKGEGFVVTVKVNRAVKGDVNTMGYFHKTHQDLLLASAGKIAKFVVVETGNYININAVLEIDGVKVEPVDDGAETKAKLLASDMDFTAEDLDQLFSKFCNRSWPDVVTKLEAEKLRRDSPDEEAAE